MDKSESATRLNNTSVILLDVIVKNKAINIPNNSPIDKIYFIT